MSSETTLEILRANRLERSEWVLLFAIMAFCFIPSINQLIIDRLITDMGQDVLNIAGQIEWFDLFNETILAFLTVPMYFVLNKVANNRERFGSRIMQTMVIGLTVYTAVSVIIYLYAKTLTAYMTAPPESVEYLRLETVGFVLSFISSYLYVVLVICGKWKYIVIMLLAKVSLLSVSNLSLIPNMGVTGIALTNILVNLVMSACALLLVNREGLLSAHISFDKDTMKDWFTTGLCSGGQILVNNLVYMLVVMKMVNDVSGMGDYWLANNFIWGWLLIPATAFGEIVKRDYYKGYRRIYNYLAFMALLGLVWLLSVPLWNVMFTDVIVTEDPQAVLDILYKLVPFYLSYIVCVVLQSVLTSVGRTDYLLYSSMFVNFIYYGIVYGLFLAGVFEASIDFIIMMFGFGMVVSMFVNMMFFRISRKKIPEEVMNPSGELA